MKTKGWMMLTLGLVVVAALVAQVSLAVLAQGKGTPAGASPEQVTESFYAWYLGYGRAENGERVGNALADGAYRDSELLAPAFIEQVDALIASFDKGGYDPFLCAQDVPSEVMVGEAVVEGDQATVVVNTSFAGHTLTVKLALTNGQWLITDIRCGTAN